MGTLLVDHVNLNNTDTVRNVQAAVRKLVGNISSYYSLKFKPPYYFETPKVSLPSDKGWYILLHDRTPIYVGRAADLNGRLNSDNGSRDNFGNKKRAPDAERNFIKKFAELGIFSKLMVCVLRESDICAEASLNSSNLTDRDRGNIEKLIDIFRGHFTYR